MDVIGNGVDIIKNSRINSSLKIKGFLNRIFTKNEIEQGKKLKNKINFYAKRFAAKEAFVKAIGSGFRSDINFIFDLKPVPIALTNASFAANLFA